MEQCQSIFLCINILLYVLGNVGNHFSVNTDTGTFELLKELDYETMAEFNLSVQVTDGLYNVCKHFIWVFHFVL